jgi:hypothetical protein
VFRPLARLPREALPVAASDLVAWYPFRSGTGEDITAGDSNFGDTTDYSASVQGATFQASGGVTDIKTGANSGAFDFDGTDDTLDLGTVADSDQSLTVMTWVNPDTVTKSFMRLVTKVDGANTSENGGIILSTESDGDGGGFVVSGANRVVLQGPPTLSTGSYTHLAGRYDFQAGTMTLFQDGQPVANGNPGQAVALSSRKWVIGEDGASAGNDNFLDGTADGTRIYTAALSDSQINQIYLNTKP